MMARDILYALLLAGIYMAIYMVSWRLLGEWGPWSNLEFAFSVMAGFVGLAAVCSRESD